MRVAVTGTPGTGKTTATGRLETPLDVIHLNEIVRREGMATGEDGERGSLIADTDAVAAYLDGREDTLVESHLAHRFPADRVVVLRCRPDLLVERLRERGESEASATENAEAEALDVILSEAVERHGRDAVYEIDTTGRSPAEVTRAIEAVVDGEREPSVGTVSFVDYLEP